MGDWWVLQRVLREGVRRGEGRGENEKA